MSIIHEALKKVQDNLDRFKEKKESVQASTPVGPSTKTPTLSEQDISPSQTEMRAKSFEMERVISQTTLTDTEGPEDETVLNNARKIVSSHPDSSSRTDSFARTQTSVSPPISVWLAAAACFALGVGLVLLVMLYTNTRPTSDGRIVKGLEGVAQVNGQTVALIDGEMYRIGDVYKGNKIIAIQWNEVTLKDPAGRMHRLKRIGRPQQ